MPNKAPLQEYRSKRDFKKTSEPDTKSKGSKGNLYVVQRHDATRLHYDLRLEHDGVLLSWAVPKQPTMDPSVKRLAVRVEDHPVSYGDFEGTIPKGNYGAGTVEIWDRGSWNPHGDVEKSLKKGHLEFEIAGDRLSGLFDLVRMGEPGKKENWLLIKRQEEAEPAQQLGFMLCKTSEKPPPASGWLSEIKWDGYRAMVFREGKMVRIMTRGGNQLKLPHLEGLLLDLLPDNTVLDGELVVLDSEGRSSFRQLQNLLPDKDSSITLVVFDLLKEEGTDLRSEPLETRRKKLEQRIKEKGSIRLSIQIPGSPKDALDACCQLGYEGIICKKKGSTYQSSRSSDWLKVKCRKDQQFVIVGYTDHSSDEKAIGALVLAEKTNGALRYAGRVGTGFSQDERHNLKEVLSPHFRKTTPVEFPDSQSKRGVHFTAPIYEARIKYLQQSPEGVLRQASYDGLAEVKMKEETINSIKVTHGDRVIDPRSKTTKQQIADYYAKHLDLVYAQLKGRAASLIRCPEGISGDCFFQRNPPNHKIEGTGSIDVEGHTYLTIEEPEAILNLVQYGTIEFHPWGALAENYTVPDTVVFDLDPGEGVEWKDVVEAAESIHSLLRDLRLAAFPRLSGGKGIHIVIPIKPELGWDEIKSFARTFAEDCARRHKNLIAESSKAKRKGKIYVDWLRNSQHATAVSSYSLRARPGIPIAMPVAWDDLPQTTSADMYTISDTGLPMESNPWGDWRAQASSLKKSLGL